MNPRTHSPARRPRRTDDGPDAAGTRAEVDRDLATRRAPGRRDALLALLLVTLGGGVASVSLLGPLGLARIDYHVGPDMENQIVGGDVVALVVVSPLCALAAALTTRGHRAGPLLALPTTAFALYLYPQLAVGGEFVTEAGNSERFFPLYLGVFWLAALGLLRAWTSIDRRTLPAPGRTARRAAGVLLLLIALFLVLGLHLRGLVDVLDGPPYGIDYTQGPTVFWIVKWMDLGIVVPLCVVTAAGLLRRSAWAPLLGYAVVGWGALLGSAVAAMGLVMVVNDDPAASPAATGVLVVFALAFWVVALALFRPLSREG